MKFPSSRNGATGRLLVMTLTSNVLIGAAMVLWLTPWGIGVTHDSVMYIDASRNLSGGRGFCESTSGVPLPVSHYPPLYPCVLSLWSLIGGIDPARGARSLNAVLLGLNLAMVGFMTYRATSGTILAVWAVTVPLLASSAVLSVHVTAWSEPLFLLLAFGGMALLDIGLADPKGRATLLAAGCCFAAAALARFAGLVLLPFAVSAAFAFGRGPWARKVADAARVGVPALVATGLWMCRNRLVTGHATNRRFRTYGLSWKQLEELGATLRSWFDPGCDVRDLAPIHLFPIVAIGAAAIIVAKYRVGVGPVPEGPADGPRSRLWELIVMFGGMYLGFVLITVAFADPSTPLDDRIMVPLFVAMAVGLVVPLGRRWRKPKRDGTSLVPGALIVLLAGFWGVCLAERSRSLRSESRQSGLGLAAKALDDFPLAVAIRGLPATAKVYALRFDNVSLYYLCHRPIRDFDRLVEDPVPEGGARRFAAFWKERPEGGASPRFPDHDEVAKTLIPGQLYELARRR